jgi:formate hydrogenlyase subunit 7
MPVWTWFGVRSGRVTTPWPERPGPEGRDGVRGLPRLDASRCDTKESACVSCVAACPADAVALANDRPALDYGRCVGCGLCVEACPRGVFAAEGDRALATRSREALRRPDDGEAVDAPFATEDPRARELASAIRAFGRSLHIRHVDAGSCNGCESELQALVNPFYNLHRLGIFFTPSPRFADLLLVTGPVTRAMEAPLRNTWEAMPHPRFVMAVGTCATGGGTNGGGAGCRRGLEGLLPVDVWLPGCPPTPASIIEALLLLVQRRAARPAGAHRER